jgi:hypothetical protein
MSQSELFTAIGDRSFCACPVESEFPSSVLPTKWFRAGCSPGRGGYKSQPFALFLSGPVPDVDIGLAVVGHTRAPAVIHAGAEVEAGRENSTDR